jgi:hypothetical protein
VADHDDYAPVELVRDVSGKQYQTQKRQKLRQTDEAEIQHMSGDVIHLPADRHDDHLRGNGGEKSRAQVQREVAVLQNRESAGGVIGTQS